jgi:hypothetical protein
MNLKSLLAISVALFTLTAYANNPAAIKELLDNTTPHVDSAAVIADMNNLITTTQKADFPSDAADLKDLTGQTSHAIKNKSFASAYKKALADLPKNTHQANKWVNKLENATAMPTAYFVTAEGGLVSLSACKPHDCPTNLKLVYSTKSKTVWGLLHDDKTKKFYLLGQPTTRQVALLLLTIGDDMANN